MLNRVLSFILFIGLFFTGFSQKIKVEFVIKNDSLSKREKRDFIYLDKDLDVTKARYIGRFKVTNSLNSVNIAMMALTDKAQKKGANSFKFVDFKNEKDFSEILIDTYVIDNEIKETNINLRPKNKVFFFGKDNMKKESSEEYKLNGILKNLKSMHYSEFDYDIPITISKGKTFGSVLKLKKNNEGSSEFINFQGFGATASTDYRGGFGISFSGGNIYNMDPNFALLMLNIYKKQD